MVQRKHTEKKRNILVKVMRFLAYTVIGALVISVALHFNWKYSGSGEWEFVHEIDKVRVYSQKEPGEVLKRFKVIGRFQSKLAGIVKLMRDPEACADVGCVESYIIETKDYPRFVYYTFRYNLPEPFQPRDFVVLSEFYQNEDTKEIYVDYSAALDKLPETDCCVRVTHMKNIWRFTPLENGEVEVEFIMDNHPGGFIPYFLANPEMQSSMHLEIPELQKVLNKEKYRNAVVDYVQEVEQKENLKVVEVDT